MDKLLKYALDSNAVGFIGRLKDKMSAHKDDVISDITRQTAADMAGVEVQESESADLKKKLVKMIKEMEASFKKFPDQVSKEDKELLKKVKAVKSITPEKEKWVREVTDAFFE